MRDAWWVNLRRRRHPPPREHHDRALGQFRPHCHDPSITKWDIFHYIYAVLHHPEYRERYSANLRRELPRIPFASSTTCHPEAVESLAERATPNEGPMHLAGTITAAHESIGPSARKERGPQDDTAVFRALARAGQRLAEIHQPSPRIAAHSICLLNQLSS